MPSRTGPSRAEATELSRAPDADAPVGPDAPLMDVMATMRAMRRLKPDPVPERVLEAVVRAATWAPSGSDAQHYGFVVVTDRDVMAELGELWRDVVDTYAALMGRVVPGADDDRHARMADALRYQAEHFDDTPALVAACYRRSGPGLAGLLDVRGNAALARELGAGRIRKLLAGARAASGLAEASSIYPAVQNLLLAARAHGLGATMTVWHLFREGDFRRVLGVPDDHGIYALVPIGYPLGRFGPVRRRPVDDVLHWQRW
ncbi:MAG: nitroreductase family protein [Ilumatobacteraceae bacterium]